MGTYNDGLKYSTKFAAEGTGTATSGTLYTVPANSYAIINYMCFSNVVSGVASLSVDGVQVAANAQGGTVDMTRAYSSGVVYAGAGAVISFSKGNTTSTRVYITGVVLKNIA